MKPVVSSGKNSLPTVQAVSTIRSSPNLQTPSPSQPRSDSNQKNPSTPPPPSDGEGGESNLAESNTRSSTFLFYQDHDRSRAPNPSSGLNPNVNITGYQIPPTPTSFCGMPPPNDNSIFSNEEITQRHRAHLQNLRMSKNPPSSLATSTSASSTGIPSSASPLNAQANDPPSIGQPASGPSGDPPHHSEEPSNLQLQPNNAGVPPMGHQPAGGSPAESADPAMHHPTMPMPPTQTTAGEVPLPESHPVDTVEEPLQALKRAVMVSAGVHWNHQHSRVVAEAYGQLNVHLHAPRRFLVGFQIRVVPSLHQYATPLPSGAGHHASLRLDWQPTRAQLEWGRTNDTLYSKCLVAKQVWSPTADLSGSVGVGWYRFGAIAIPWDFFNPRVAPTNAFLVFALEQQTIRMTLPLVQLTTGMTGELMVAPLVTGQSDLLPLASSGGTGFFDTTDHGRDFTQLTKALATLQKKVDVLATGQNRDGTLLSKLSRATEKGFGHTTKSLETWSSQNDQQFKRLLQETSKKCCTPLDTPATTSSVDGPKDVLKEAFELFSTGGPGWLQALLQLVSGLAFFGPVVLLVGTGVTIVISIEYIAIIRALHCGRALSAGYYLKLHLGRTVCSLWPFCFPMAYCLMTSNILVNAWQGRTIVAKWSRFHKYCLVAETSMAPWQERLIRETMVVTMWAITFFYAWMLRKKLLTMLASPQGGLQLGIVVMTIFGIRQVFFWWIAAEHDPVLPDEAWPLL